MELQVKKWGNSLGLRIPQAIANQVNIQDGSTINLILKKNKIEIVPIESENYELDDLINSITDSNLYSEISVGEPIGNEIW